MPNNVIVSRLKPQLVRKRVVVKVPPTVKVVVKNNGQQQVKTPKELKPQKPNNAIRRQVKPVKPTPPPAQSPPPSNAVVQGRNRRNIRRATKVRYATRNLSLIHI